MRRVGVSASSTLAANAGARVADAGGNAVDAAAASAVVGMISEPGIIGPGAGGFVTIWPSDRDPVVIDGYAAMPGLASGAAPTDFGTEVHLGYGGGMTTRVGASSVAVPGIWAGLGAAVEQYGRLPWVSVMQPAVEVAEAGFPLSQVSESYLAYAHDPIYDVDPESFKALHHPDGTRLSEGDMVRIGGLAECLRVLAEEGPEAFYGGSIGTALSVAMEEWRGSVTREDLVSYEPAERAPTLLEFGGWAVATNPPPAIGGVVLAAMLLLIEGSGFTGYSEGGARLMASVQRSVLGYRSRHLDGVSHGETAAEALLGLARLGDHTRLLDSPSTINVSAVDTDGTGCALTASAGYGSGMMIPGTGLWLNNSLGEVELFPKGMSGFAPGDRLPSNMAPTVARGPEGAVMALGSPGASRITTALAQVLANFVNGMSISEAVGHARLHVEVFEGKPTIAHEPGLPVEEFDDFAVRRFPDLSMYFGGVGVAMFDTTAGLFNVADPRRDGATAVGGQ